MQVSGWDAEDGDIEEEKNPHSIYPLKNYHIINNKVMDFSRIASHRNIMGC